MGQVFFSMMELLSCDNLSILHEHDAAGFDPAGDDAVRLDVANSNDPASFAVLHRLAGCFDAGIADVGDKLDRITTLDDHSQRVGAWNDPARRQHAFIPGAD